MKKIIISIIMLIFSAFYTNTYAEELSCETTKTSSTLKYNISFTKDTIVDRNLGFYFLETLKNKKMVVSNVDEYWEYTRWPVEFDHIYKLYGSLDWKSIAYFWDIWTKKVLIVNGKNTINLRK